MTHHQRDHPDKEAAVAGLRVHPTPPPPAGTSPNEPAAGPQFHEARFHRQRPGPSPSPAAPCNRDSATHPPPPPAGTSPNEPAAGPQFHEARFHRQRRGPSPSPAAPCNRETVPPTRHRRPGHRPPEHPGRPTTDHPLSRSRGASPPRGALPKRRDPGRGPHHGRPRGLIDQQTGPLRRRGLLAHSRAG